MKKFQLSNPQLYYDYILFDEGQDASAAMLDVFLHQPAIKIIVGDVHQQIYGWRYAVNSLQQVDFPLYVLSNSFRFDDEIALMANKILVLLLRVFAYSISVVVLPLPATALITMFSLVFKIFCCSAVNCMNSE